MDNPVIVIDNGSVSCKAGFAGDDLPKVVFPAIVGSTKYQLTGEKDYYVGHEAYSQIENLNIEYPMDRSVVTNWDVMEKIWHHCFYKELNINPEEYCVIVTEPVMNPKSNREKIMEILFEKFNVRAMYVSIPAQMSIYAAGRGIALGVDIGDGLIHIVPIYEGYALHKGIQRIEFGGCDLTEYMAKLLTARGYRFENIADKEHVKKLKEALCYVAEDFEEEKAGVASNSSLVQNYQLPNGGEISVGEERFCCPEALFDPWLMELDHCGIHKIIYNSIMKCGIDTRKNFFANILISGGTSLIPGFAERLQKEVKLLIPSSIKVKIIASPERYYSAWIGTSIMGSFSTFEKSLITRKEYDELGPSALKKTVL